MKSFLLSLILFAQVTVGPAITLQLDKNVGYQPLDVQTRTTIEPNYLNQWVCITWESETEGPHRGCWSLDGEYSAKYQYYDLKKLPVGTYTVFATVKRVRDFENTPAQQIQVLDRSY